MKQTQTDWEELYQQRDTPWEKGRPHPALVDFLAEHGPLAGEICVPGCGSGHDVRALTTATNQVLGIDLAPFAVKKAKSMARVANEQYLLADLFALPNELDGRFDWIFEHTCFCAIDPALRRSYVATIVRLLKPGGRLLAIFFLNPDHDEEGPPYCVSRDELEQLFDSSFTIEREWVPARTHPGREGRELMRVLRSARASQPANLNRAS
jgi:SAM-dependent methyltransferase